MNVKRPTERLPTERLQNCMNVKCPTERLNAETGWLWERGHALWAPSGPVRIQSAAERRARHRACFELKGSRHHQNGTRNQPKWRGSGVPQRTVRWVPLLPLPKTSEKAKNKPPKLNEKTKIKSRIKEDKKENENDFGNFIQDNLISNKDRLSQSSNKLIKKTIFNPQPYRIILRLSGANPSAPAETVTEALRKAGVQFEVEKIERFDEENFSKNTSLKR